MVAPLVKVHEPLLFSSFQRILLFVLVELTVPTYWVKITYTCPIEGTPAGKAHMAYIPGLANVFPFLCAPGITVTFVKTLFGTHDISRMSELGGWPNTDRWLL